VLALQPVALAAQSPAADSARVDSVRVIPVAPVRVTVLRTPLPVERVPYAVTVEQPDRPTGPGLTLAERLTAAGLQVDNRYAFSEGDRIVVRGFGARSQFGVRGVKVLVDGVPATLPDGQTSLSHLDPWRVERAEVLRGPASSRWGNAAGGVIRLRTAPPASAGSGAGATAAMGDHGLRRTSLHGDWAKGPLRLRTSGSHFSWDGFRAHAATDKLYGALHADWRGDRDALSVVAHGVDYTAEAAGSLSTDQLAEDRSQANPFHVVQDVGEAASQGQVGVTWERRLGPRQREVGRDRPRIGAAPDADRAVPVGPVMTVTGWALARSLDNPIPPVVIDLERRAAGVRASLRGALEAGGRDVAWAAGVDAEGQWDDRRNHENEGGRRGALVLDQTERVRAIAPFLEAGARVVGPIRALVGLRWDAYTFTADDRLISAANPDDSGTRTMSALSPSLGLVAALSDATLYANVASSFETPTTTELVNRPTSPGGLNPELDPQRAVSVEAGVRARAGNRAAVQLAVYRSAIDDALIPFEVPGAPGRSFFRNAGEAVHRGVEVDGWTAIGERLTVRLAYAWTDARFTDFATADDDLSGNRVPGVAPHRLEAAVSWEPWTGSRLEVAERWVAAVPVDDANTADAPAYAITSLRATLRPVRLGPLEIQPFLAVDNLLDREHISSVVVNAFGGRYYEPGPGRSLYGGLRLNTGG
jgi:iron complex outermembrane receptor protein